MASDTRNHFIEIDGVRLHWAEIGEASAAPPVVLLHGLNNSCCSWSQVAPLLATDRRVLMPDLPGHGQSSRVCARSACVASGRACIDCACVTDNSWKSSYRRRVQLPPQRGFWRALSG